MTLMTEYSLTDCSQLISNKSLSPELPGNLRRAECLSTFWAGYTTTANGKTIKRILQAFRYWRTNLPGSVKRMLFAFPALTLN